MTTNEKISLLVPEQVPDFVRADYPKFVSFIQAYYRFLEEQQGTNDNDLVTKSKALRHLSDVDSSLDLFEEQFFNTFLSFLPKDVMVTKEFLIKNALPIYLAKGSEESFKFLFRLLFDDEVTVTYPRNYILRASDGKWKRDSSILIADNIQTEVTADGIETEFYLNQILESTEFAVYVNNVLQVEDTNYTFRKEYQKVVFTTAPAANATVKITYTSFDASSLASRKLTGVTSGAYAIIESVERKLSTNLSYYDVFVDPNSVQGTFSEGEEFLTQIYLNNELVNVRMNALSRIKEINIIDGGSGYAVGDPVIIRGLSIVPATAIVSRVASGLISELSIVNAGAGFQPGAVISAEGISNTVFNASVLTVNSSGEFTPNTVTFFIDTIDAYGAVTLDAVDYGFSNTANINTVISQALTANSITVGSILTTNISVATAALVNPVLDVKSPAVAGSGANTIYLKDLGIIGQIGITSGGSGYEVGDALNFTNHPMAFSGSGLTAEVSHVSANGAITNILVTNGGSAYQPGYFPIVSSVTSANGVGAVLYVASVLGDGESLVPIVPGGLRAGEIQTIRIIEGGRGYSSVPEVDLTASGDGNALASAEIFTTYNRLPGRWTSAEGLLSTEEIRIEGAEYYVNYSYVISCKTEFSKYKEIFKELVHPIGAKALSQYTVDENIKRVKSNIVPVQASYLEPSSFQAISYNFAFDNLLSGPGLDTDGIMDFMNNYSGSVSRIELGAFYYFGNTGFTSNNRVFYGDKFESYYDRNTDKTGTITVYRANAIPSNPISTRPNTEPLFAFKYTDVDKRTQSGNVVYGFTGTSVDYYSNSAISVLGPFDGTNFWIEIEPTNRTAGLVPSGTVSINTNSNIVTGINTKFEVANTKGILVVGSNVAINGEIRTVNAIVSNTEITVTQNFLSNSNNQMIIIL
jgi:hypothetical protein